MTTQQQAFLLAVVCGAVAFAILGGLFVIWPAH
jgi:hypothetical protein